MYDRQGALGRLLGLEAEGSEAARRYARALRALADALRDRRCRERTQEELIRWLLQAVGLEALEDVVGRRTAWEEAQWDAVVDLVADATALADFLEQVAERLGASRPRNLNLRSLLRARVVWRARDKLRRREALQKRRAESARGDEQARVASRGEQQRWVAALVVQRVARRAEEEDAEMVEALAGLLEGRSVSEVSRRTGLSRQQIYRRLARIRAWIEDEGAPDRRRAGAKR